MHARLASGLVQLRDVVAEHNGGAGDFADLIGTAAFREVHRGVAFGEAVQIPDHPLERRGERLSGEEAEQRSDGQNGEAGQEEVPPHRSDRCCVLVGLRCDDDPAGRAGLGGQQGRRGRELERHLHQEDALFPVRRDNSRGDDRAAFAGQAFESCYAGRQPGLQIAREAPQHPVSHGPDGHGGEQGDAERKDGDLMCETEVCDVEIHDQSPGMGLN
ncbi:MAG: hypothetical protein ACXWVL_01835 [Rhodoplanes sp.]